MLYNLLIYFLTLSIQVNATLSLPLIFNDKNWRKNLSSFLLALLKYFKPLQPGVAFLYALKTSENLQVFWCFQKV